MIAMFKALPMGVFMTLLAALFLGSGGFGGGTFAVFGFMLEGTRLYWSWPLFCLSTALAWTILLMMRD